MLVKDKTGQTFGRLKVLYRTENSPNHRHAVWMCECICGALKTVDSQSLRTGRTRSCGCLQKEEAGYASRIRPFESTYNRVRETARDKGHDFDLTYEEFLIFTRTTECHYCLGVVPWMPHGHGQIGRTRYNLDRKDNDKGYSFLNCVVCCKRCNRGKSDLFTYEEWWKMTETLRREHDNQVNIRNRTNGIGDGTLYEEADGKGSPVETADSGREVETGEISNNPA